jgi:hypothetical protein
MRYGIVIALGLVALPAPAAEKAEVVRRAEQPLAAKGTVDVENLLGSIEIRGGGPAGKATIEARVVAEGDTYEAAKAIVDAVEMKVVAEAGAVVVRPVIPVDRYVALRMPRADAEGQYAKWIAPLLKRDKVAYPWDGRTVSLGNQRDATPLAVHVVVTVPHDSKVNARQIVGPVSVHHARGSFTTESVDGGITVEQVYGAMEARTTASPVEVRTFKGASLVIETVSGNIDIVDARAADARLRTTSGEVVADRIEGISWKVEAKLGDVRFARTEAVSLEVATTEGGIDVTSGLTGTKNAVLKSETADIALHVGTGSHFDAELRSGSGDFAVKGLELKEIAREPNVMKYRQGSGGAKLVLETGDGTAQLARSK